jgi:hypothetical protein
MIAPPVESSARRAFRHGGCVVLSVLAFFVGGAVVAAAIGACLPMPEIVPVTTKLEHFRAHADEYTAIFFGSSRVYHQLIPSQFDAALREAGVESKSFNAGVDGMHMPELAYYAEQYLRCRPAKLRWVFIEAGPLRLSADDAKRDTIRDLYWHDWRRLAITSRYAFVTRKRAKKEGFVRNVKSYREPLANAWFHAGIFLERFLSLGRGGSVMNELLAGGQRVSAALALGRNGDGYMSSLSGEQITPGNRQRLAETVADRLAEPAKESAFDDVSQKAYEALLERFERSGVTTVQFLPPTTAGSRFRLRSQAKKPRAILDYADVVRYAPLFAPENRLNDDHVNESGAKILTRLVAEDFIRSVDPQGGGAGQRPGR